VPAPKKADEDQAIGRSRGGLSTKIHTLVDALGNPIGFHLAGGEAHDLVGADHLLPDMQADMLIADKAFDADKRVIERLTAAGKAAVIPSRPTAVYPANWTASSTKLAIRQCDLAQLTTRPKRQPGIAARGRRAFRHGAKGQGLCRHNGHAPHHRR
jgi:transposase